MRGQKWGDEVTGPNEDPGDGYRTERQVRIEIGVWMKA